MKVATVSIWQKVLSFLTTAIGFLIGEVNGLLIALFVLITINYITGVLRAIFVTKNLSSDVGGKGIAKKGIIILLVILANTIDTQVIKSGSALKTLICLYYISNEGISIMENCGALGMPLPNKLRQVLIQINKDTETEVPENMNK